MFIDEDYRVYDYKTDPKKMFLFGFNQTIREKLFLKCWSPELYILDGLREVRTTLSLKAEKTNSYIIANCLMPKEEDIVSFCLDDNKIYLLSNSPLIHEIGSKDIRFILYQGSLSNMTEIFNKRDIIMSIKYSFHKKYERFLEQKTIFPHD